ncbi:MAG: glycosyltransferase [Cetobacterium sp.]
MKTVGFCINSLEMGGAEKLLVDLINLLFETGNYKIYLITKNESNSEFYREIKDRVNYSYLISKRDEDRNKNYGIIGSFFSSIQKKQKFKEFIDELDIVIDFLDGDFYKFIKSVKGKEKIVWLHSGYKELQLKKRIDEKLKYYNKTIVITEAMLKEMKQKTKVQNISMIYNLIDFKKIDRLLLSDINLEDKVFLNEKFFLTVCRLDEKQKDIKTLLKSFYMYTGEEFLYIIGDGPSRKELEEFVDILNLKSRVKFLGKKNNPFIYMEKCKSFILSTKNEGFGLVIAEALYCGAKVVASNCEYGPEEILLGGEIGELVSVGNEFELLKGIQRSIQVDYPENMIKKSLERFKKENILEQVKEVLNVRKNKS